MYPLVPARRLARPSREDAGWKLPGSGTEYEIAWALDHANKNRGVPRLHVFRNCSKPTPPLEPKEDREAFGQQWDSLEEYFARWLRNTKGSLVGALNKYNHLEEFEELFRRHFRDFLRHEVDQEIKQEGFSRRVRLWKSNPFRGLNVFDFKHAPIFHGRTKAIGEVLQALEEQSKERRPFVLIVGASGSGKSSLVRAGVLPLLTQPGTIEGIGLWRRTITRPGAGEAAVIASMPWQRRCWRPLRFRCWRTWNHHTRPVIWQLNSGNTPTASLFGSGMRSITSRGNGKHSMNILWRKESGNCGSRQSGRG